MKKNRIIAGVLSLAISVSAIAAFSFSSVTAQDVFDENNVVSRLGILSDVHQTGTANDRDEQRLRTAIRRLYELSDNNLDGISISGDLTDYKIEAGLKQFKKVMDEELKGDTRLTFTLGNHDIDAIKYDNKNLAYDILGDDYYSYDEADSNVSLGNRHTVMGGYHFLSVYTNDFWNNEGPSFRADTKQWLDTQLKKITQENPNQYVFVSAHPVIQDTVYGSEAEIYDKYWSTKDLTPILSKYPQVIALGGHLHHAINDERAIWQGDFTALNVGSLREVCFEEKGYVETGNTSIFPGCEKYSVGYYFEADKNNNMRIRRIDFYNGGEIKSPWILVKPNAEKTHLNSYTDARKDTNTAPVFPENAEIRLKETLPRSFTAIFDKAEDDDMVYSYRVEAYNKTEDKTSRQYKMLSYFHSTPNPADMQAEFVRTVGNLADGNEWEIKVYAIDSWGAESEPLVYNYGPETIPTSADEIISNNLNIVTSGLSLTDKSEKNHKLVKGAGVKVTKDEQLTQNTISFDGTENATLKLAFSDDEINKLKTDFTTQVYFKLNNTSTSNQTIFSTGEKGINVYVDGATKCLMAKVNIGGQVYIYKSSGVIVKNKYYYFAIEYNNNELAMILDGNKVRTMFVQGDIEYSSNDLTIGYKQDGENIIDNLNGSIYKFKTTDEFYSLSHLRLLYNDAKTFETTNGVIGDVNGDGVCNTLDSLIILKHCAQIEILSDAELSVADYNGDGLVNTLDSLTILKVLIGLE